MSDHPQQERGKLKQLSEDLVWLEQYCRSRPELEANSGEIHLAAALARNVIAGGLEKQAPVPLYVAVVGGAGAGKSTVVNLLVGSVVADANPQAGYTRHPTAYLPAAQHNALPSYFGFLSSLRQATQPVAANLDEDIYQVRKIPAKNGPDPLDDFVVWDCPDMTTWASSSYVARLMEVAALADVLVYVASDERYNDEVPTQFLQLLVQAGKAVIVCLTKMKPSQMTPMIEHFRANVLGRITEAGEIPPVPILAIPQLSLEERQDPARMSPYRVQLLNQLLVLCPTPEQARSRTVKNAINYLETAGVRSLDVARKDLAELETWKASVEHGRNLFEHRYRNEYLAGEPFRRFDRTRDQLLQMLEVPSSIKFASAFFALLRLPYSYCRDFVGTMMARPVSPNLSEEAVLSTAFAAWLESLQAETLKRGQSHLVWKQLAVAFETELKRQAIDRFQTASRQFELTESKELENAGRSMTDWLGERSMLLGTIRISKLAIDVAAIVLVLYYTWVPSWYTLILIPLAVAITHQVFEWLVQGAVEAARTNARIKRESVLREQITGPLATWLIERPSVGGSSVERLQATLKRIPLLIQELAQEIRVRLNPPAPTVAPAIAPTSPPTQSPS